MPVITLPDGSQREFNDAVTVMQVAEDIGPGLAKATIAGRVNGNLVDACDPIEEDASLSIITSRDQEGIEIMEAEGKKPANWVNEMLASGSNSFYSVDQGATYFYDIPSKSQTKKPGQDAFIILDNIRQTNEVWKNSGVVIEDLGDGRVLKESLVILRYVEEAFGDGPVARTDPYERGIERLMIAREGPFTMAGYLMVMNRDPVLRDRVLAEPAYDPSSALLRS